MVCIYWFLISTISGSRRTIMPNLYIFSFRCNKKKSKSIFVIVKRIKVSATGMSHFARILSLILSAAFLSGCGEKVSTSYWGEEPIPIEIKISVSDTHGNNMLDPTKTSNLSANQISAEFMGNVYMRDSAPKNGISLWTIVDEEDKPHILVFGQIPGSKALDSEPLVIDWGDGSHDTITIYNKYSWSIDHAPSLERHIVYNGKDYYGNATVEITR